MSGSSSTRSSAARACARCSGAERALVIAEASHEGALEARLAVALAKRARAAAKAQSRALEHRNRRAQLVHVSEHVRCEEQGAALPAQAPEHGFHRHPRSRVKPAHRLVEHLEPPPERGGGGGAPPP